MTSRNIRPSFLALCLFLAALGHSLAAEPYPEYNVKAAILYYFAQLTTWPEKAFPSPTSPVRIGILGEDPFGRVLPDTVRGKQINGRRLEVVPVKTDAEICACHLLFISRSEEYRADELIAFLREKPVLTISEVNGFAKKGGMIRFFLSEKKVRFELNAQAVKAAGLQVSSRLLLLAKLVKSD